VLEVWLSDQQVIPVWVSVHLHVGEIRNCSRLRLKCDGTRAETRFRLSAKRTSQLNRRGASGQSTTGSRVVRISGSNVGYTMFRGSVKGTGYPLHSPVSPSRPLPCVTVCYHISTGLYLHTCVYRAVHESSYFGYKQTRLQVRNTRTFMSHK
jgi:hypothetical protein